MIDNELSLGAVDQQDLSEKKIVPRDAERFIDISGMNEYGRSKAHVVLRHYEQFSDGTANDIQSITLDKPIINIFSHAGYRNIYLDFGSNDDVDLRLMWNVLSEYKQASNSVSYLPDELERGYYSTAEGDRMVYFPVLELILSPVGKETEYQIHGYNPAFFTLSVNDIKGEPCVLQFTFPEDWLVVVNDLDDIDYSKIYYEAMDELKKEHR